MAACSSSSAKEDNHRTDANSHPRDTKHRRPHLNHLHVQVPAVANNAGCFAGCFRPSPTSASSAGHAHAHGHGDRPASPSLIRSPSAWIRAKGQSFGSAKHTRRRSRDFQYDAHSYARNFDEGGTDGEGEEEAGLAASDTLKYRCFSSRLPTSPPPASPSGLGPGSAGNGIGKEPSRETGRDLE